MRNWLLCGLFVFFPAMVSASTTFRTNSWEASFYLKQQNGFDVEFEDGNYVDVNDDVGFGFRFGYNYTANLNLNVKFDVVTPAYNAYFTNPSDPTDRHNFRQESDQWSVMFNGLYNFSIGDFSPFVEAGIGWVTTDSNVADGRPVTDCWWDYWWGYSCETWQSTYTESNFAYEVGAGVRYDFPNRWFIRGALTSRWTEFNFARETSNLVGFQVELGSMVWSYY